MDGNKSADLQFSYAHGIRNMSVNILPFDSITLFSTHHNLMPSDRKEIPSIFIFPFFSFFFLFFLKKPYLGHCWIGHCARQVIYYDSNVSCMCLCVCLCVCSCVCHRIIIIEKKDQSTAKCIFALLLVLHHMSAKPVASLAKLHRVNA